MVKPTLIKFPASKTSGTVSALLLRPPEARRLFVFGHGAGAGMRHPFMEIVSQRLAEAGIATFRYQFPYMENKIRRPDPRPVLLATVRAAIEAALKADDSLPLVAGGKSMGGRMTSLAASEEQLEGVHGIVFLGFPLHPPGNPGTARSDHLHKLNIPMLFLQGTRDKLANLDLLQSLCDNLPQATLHIVEGGDHSFKLLKGAGRTQDDTLDELVGKTVEWTDRLLLQR
ncbi:MAG: dienelactone hydrolase family protein [Ignavibacteriales bacterium]|nr:dienelactone hydrolase family protein [Ignavibacteriales bacterium]